MSMVVQHNMQSMNANRMLGITTGQQAKSTEKLSSGYRINRAADDAAGLSISEKMRKQIKGLDRATSNAQDGVSAVQTAEGALTEVHSMLQRMNELATQASNGTQSEDDRTAIQAEIEQLTTEIDRVAETTKFNETYLLKGDPTGAKSTKNVNAHDAGIDGTLTDNGKTATFKLNSELNNGDKVTIAGEEYTIGTVINKEITTDGLAEVGSLNTSTAAVGDSITDSSTGITYTYTNKLVAGANAANLGDLKAEDTFTITDANGNVNNYTVKTSSTGDEELTIQDAKTIIQDALDNGGTVKLTKYNSAATDLEVVKSLVSTGANQEIAYNAAAITTAGQPTVAELATAASITLVADDSVTLNGNKTTYTTEPPKTASDISDVIKTLQLGDTVAINRNGAGAVTLTVGSETDDVAKTYTIDDILSNIKENDVVTITGSGVKYQAAIADAGMTDATDYTVVGSLDSEENKTDVISKEDAQKKIAEELKAASSIGADEGSEASVTINDDDTYTITKGSVNVTDSLAFSLHVGADADMTNKIGVDIDSMSAAGLGIKGLNVKDNSGMAATYAIDAISDAIAKVSTQRSTLGAVQNRLEHTIANLDNVVENTTSAESAIRDTDMASEMVNFSKNNILAQAGQSMLAQANQSNQGVLSLLG